MNAPKIDDYFVRKLFTNSIIVAVYALLVLFFLGPVLWIVSLALRTPQELFGAPRLLPRNPTLENFTYILTRTQMPTYIWNSVRLVVYSVVGTLAVSIPSAYSFSRFSFRNKTGLLLIVLLFQMISPVVIGIPLFRYFASIGLLNNYFGLSMVYIAIQTPFATFLLKGVLDGVPRELDESAHIDGASRFQVLRAIIIPSAMSGIASAVIFISINSWSQFIIPFFLLNRNSLYPVAVGVLMAQGHFTDISIQYVAAASVVGLLPAVILVLFLQRFILSALLAGALKG